MVLGCSSAAGLGSNTSLIYSPSGLFGGKYTPSVLGGLISPKYGMMGGYYINLLNGMVLQWNTLGSGSVNAGATTNVSWVFPTNFGFNCLYAHGICYNMMGSSVAYTSIGLTSISTSSVTFTVGNASSSQQSWSSMYVFALGY
jgi:hypothetical protein